MDDDEATIAALLAQELRRNNAISKLCMMYADARINRLNERIAAPLLNERESDTLRGKIAELQNLRKLIQDGGIQ